MIVQICGCMIFLLSCFPAFGQEAPPRPLSIYADPAQGLSFGTFFQGFSGGTVIIYSNGSRSVTGDVVELNSGSPFSPAVFQIEANAGTLIDILNGPDVTLTGSNGGSMILHLGNASTGTPFISTVNPPAVTQISIGGTLTVGSPMANPAGNYSGTFSVTFIQE